MDTNDLLRKSRNGELLTQPELEYLLSLPPDSPESYLVMAEARRLSAQVTGGCAEVHGQLALNLAPCHCNCAFCAFAQRNGVFTEETRLSVEEAVAYARQFVTDGANAVFLMTTAQYPFELLLEVAQEVRRNVPADIPLVANVGDQSLANARKLKEAGFAGVYHALRLREGVDSDLPPERRRQSLRTFQEAGLGVGTCVEPVGPEHTAAELAEMILFTGALHPSYSGSARRIMIPGTEIAQRGMISELRMAQVVAVTRLGVPHTVPGHCTHEPCTLGAAGGANLFWAEVGANPRDVKAKTEEGRGTNVQACQTLFREAGWEVHGGPSRYYPA